MPRDPRFEITYRAKGKLPSLPFDNFKNAILGHGYELSLVVVTPSLMRSLNKKFRNRDATTSILSFEISKKSGELIIEPKKIKLDAKAFGMTPRDFLAYTLIHGMLHLKGYAHGSKMEYKEKEYLMRFRVLK